MAILEGTQWSIISDKCANIWGNFGEVGSQSTKIEQYVRFTHRTFFYYFLPIVKRREEKMQINIVLVLQLK